MAGNLPQPANLNISPIDSFSDLEVSYSAAAAKALLRVCETSEKHSAPLTRLRISIRNIRRSLVTDLARSRIWLHLQINCLTDPKGDVLQ